MAPERLSGARADSQAELVLPRDSLGQVPAHIVEIASLADGDDAADRAARIVEERVFARKQHGRRRFGQDPGRFVEVDLYPSYGRSILDVPRREIDAETVT
jgi:hypothetical protein